MPSITFHWIWYLGFWNEWRQKHGHKFLIEINACGSNTLFSLHVSLNVTEEGVSAVEKCRAVLLYLHVLVEQHDEDEAEDPCCWYRANQQRCEQIMGNSSLCRETEMIMLGTRGVEIESISPFVGYCSGLKCLISLQLFKINCMLHTVQWKAQHTYSAYLHLEKRTILFSKID